MKADGQREKRGTTVPVGCRICIGTKVCKFGISTSTVIFVHPIVNRHRTFLKEASATVIWTLVNRYPAMGSGPLVLAGTILPQRAMKHVGWICDKRRICKYFTGSRDEMKSDYKSNVLMILGRYIYIPNSEHTLRERLCSQCGVDQYADVILLRYNQRTASLSACGQLCYWLPPFYAQPPPNDLSFTAVNMHLHILLFTFLAAFVPPIY